MKKTADSGTQALLPDQGALSRLLAGRLDDPHSILGMHSERGGVVVRVYDPAARAVTLLREGASPAPMTRIHPSGLFGIFFRRKTHFAYRLEKDYGDRVFTAEDPYQFLPCPGEMDLYLFNRGEHRRPWEFMGARQRDEGGVKGVSFAVWAPNAERVSVVGDFNCWDGRRHPMRLLGQSGVWDLFIPGLKAGDVYKYEIRTKSGDIFLKLDPYARRTELRPRNAGIVPSDTPFRWTDDDWMKARAGKNILEQPVNIYEVHLGSWGGPGLPELPEGKEFHNYRELAEALANYLQDMNYTHVELLPVFEHPLDMSWGYQVTGFYAPTARFGTPEDFAYFVDRMHRAGIGVILDWVPAHFPKDAFSLGRFDGTALYEHADPRQGEQKDWGTYIFNFGRNEVRTFLTGSALYFLENFHADGLRVDAVASMIYLNYSRNDGEWIPNKYGGVENLEAVDFLKNLNALAHKEFPGIMMTAEESTSWPGVSRPVWLGGLGFTFKWNMGWMHDTLDYFELDPLYRSYHHGKLTFSLMYAFSENFVLPLSHDEVVHGKKSLIGRMYGDYRQQFANLRALFAWMQTHPGKKMLFMGGEFAQMIEWNYAQPLDWLLLKYPAHDSIRRMVSELNRVYRETPALWENDFRPDGFEWIDVGDYNRSIFSYVRWDKKRTDPVLVILNLTPVVRDNYETGVPLPGVWREVFNTDREEYGGTGLLNGADMPSRPGSRNNRDQYITLRLPWLGAVILRRA